MKRFKNSGLFGLRVLATLVILTSVVFWTVPAGLAQGKQDRVELKLSKDQAVSKMSGFDSFADFKTASAGDVSGVVTASTAGDAAKTRYAVLGVEFRTMPGRRAVFSDQKQSTLPGAHVLTVVDRFADVFVATDAAWNALEANPNILKVEHLRSVDVPPPPIGTVSPDISQAIADVIVRGGYKSFTGKNVIIAVLDTGIDFRHPDFITYDAAGVPTSRIAYLWDTSMPYQAGRGGQAPIKFPNGTSAGTMFTQAQLTSELRAASPTIPPTDLDGHGTACASVAAGSGKADTGLKRPEVVGVAPEATIIGVRLGYLGLENSYLLNSIADWLETVAKQTPMVISGSFGGHYTGHDGQTVQERQLNARFPLTKPGRAIVFAAGNEGTQSIHAKAAFSTPNRISWVARTKTILKMYFDGADQNMSIAALAPTTLGKNLSHHINPITKQIEATLIVEAGPGAIELSNTAGRTNEAHLWFANGGLGAFSPENVVRTHLVGSPGAMENAITVGSYDWNDNFHSAGKVVFLKSVCRDATGGIMGIDVGFLSCYSSPGPLRNGTVKPEIVAPGQWYHSSNAKAFGKTAGEDVQVDSTGNYRSFNGTSAATPYVSGIIALMFQKKPTITLGEVKTLLKAHATKTGLNPVSGPIPNNRWGYGKLDNTAIGRIFAAF